MYWIVYNITLCKKNVCLPLFSEMMVYQHKQLSSSGLHSQNLLNKENVK